MNERPQYDDGISLANGIRQFRRIARLASADPLRLLGLDPLRRVASLTASATALMNVAPFERLRDAIIAPRATSSQQAARSRLPLPLLNETGKRSGAPAAPARHAAQHSAEASRHPGLVARAGDRRVHADEPQRSMPPATLAERRAAARRATESPDSATQSSSGIFIQREPTTESSPGGPIELRETAGALGPYMQHDVTAGFLHRSNAGPDGLDLFDSEEPRRPSQPFTPLREAPPGTQSTDTAPFITADRATFEPDATFTSAARHPGFTPSEERTGPRRGAGLSPFAEANSSRPIARAHGQHVPREPVTQSELADELFETLYRSGVDLPWP